MASEEGSRQIHLMEVLTARALLPPRVSEKSVVPSLKSGLSFKRPPALEARLHQLHALRRHLLDGQRLPLHRFCPLRFPLVLDADQLVEGAETLLSSENASGAFLHSADSRKSTGSQLPPALIPLSLYNNERLSGNWSQDGDNICIKRVELPRHWKSVLEKDVTLSPVEELRVILLQLVLLGSFVWVPVLLLHFWRRYCTTRRRKLFFLFGLALLFAFPRRPRPAVRLWRGWRKIHKYHRTTAVLEAPETLPPNHPTIFAVVPHGVFPMAPAMMITSDFGHLLGNFRLAAASIVRWCLVYGQLTFLADAIPASRSEMKKSLEEGRSVLVSPGGIAEMYEAGAEQERLYLKERKGLVRLAIQTGARIIPVYAFGSSQVFRLFWGVRFFQPIARLLRIAVVLMYGRFGLPVSLKLPLLFAIGKPLSFVSNERPTEEEVDAAHALLTSELRRLFETYKGLYGWREKKLQIL